MFPRILHTVGILIFAMTGLMAQHQQLAYLDSSKHPVASEQKIQKFLEKFTPHAISITKQYGIPAELTLAVGALESGWGTSHLAEFANNYFGIKAKTKEEPVYMYTTREYTNGQYVLSTTSFRRYYHPEGSFWAFARKIRLDARYNSLWTIPYYDIQGWANGLTSCGYATDPNYASKLMRVIRENQLQMWVREFSQR